MKNNIVILMFLLAVLFIGCQKDDDYEAPNSFSDVGWYFSDTEGNLATKINGYITFADLSQGVVSHEWSIGGGSYYLEMPIARQDSIFDGKIIGSGTSTEKTVSVWFKKSGLQGVRLYNVFDEKVTFRGRKDEENVFIDAEQVGDKWVIDTTFIVDVYDSIVPQIRIEHAEGGVVGHTNPQDTIFVEAGGTLNFFDETTIGRPDTWEWNVGTAKSNDQNASIVLKKLGIFKATLSISRTGQNIPGDFEFYRIPSPIKVIPSSQPFVVTPTDLMERKDQTIQVPFNGEFDAFIDQESFFSVKVNGAEFNIASVSINLDDATILDIKLSDQIYRNDDITVSYDGNGTLLSTDTRVPEAFTDLPVAMFQHEAIKFDFETGGENFVPRDGENLATTTIGISTEQAASGTNSLKMDAAASGNFSAWINYTDTFSLNAGVPVMYEYKLYKVSGTAINFLAPWINKGGNATVSQFWHNTIQSAPFDEWTTIRTQLVTPSATADDYNMYFRHNGSGTIYLDDVRIIEPDERP
ncbi:hypothetical protein FPF71_13610 [Algibacter amylolyticus]|uniref:PKD domain-containing protein n=1 Tax=Algibacter amylolyticus TaxID=1608400 RepID=A0A5M7B8R1_9FLAO|nr:hypothetical protein [Algibacter amylolyticus]KAA5823725.1 hypothetical protein F2B50_13610 [Algibacter amylolyticus]MBB5267895.1 hypothetical protein [Algibacter amylolyticus]TSJ74213.1 hypothetical protein FPF71_13610 [Algibacter amylolyticus]